MQKSKPQTYINNSPVYGLGPHLYSQNDKNSNIIGHDGSGNNTINTAARIDIKLKNGIIILETGNTSIAFYMADERIFWKAGIADYVVMTRNRSYVLIILISGYIFIVLLSSEIKIIEKGLSSKMYSFSIFNKQFKGMQLRGY